MNKYFSKIILVYLVLYSVYFKYSNDTIFWNVYFFSIDKLLIISVLLVCYNTLISSSDRFLWILIFLLKIILLGYDLFLMTSNTYGEYLYRIQNKAFSTGIILLFIIYLIYLIFPYVKKYAKNFK